MALSDWQKFMYNKLCHAIRKKSTVLVECKLKDRDEKVAVICEQIQQGKNLMVVPLGQMFSVDPVEILEPPGEGFIGEKRYEHIDRPNGKKSGGPPGQA